ncbi:DUF2155 domain-containing protein [Loktanella sp. SALINAS62]|nr:DUF2155 domain-containing protein [Loktanella sp. SALINAS62]MBS1303778.1 DUF2155 domain-containing protein [Loktanella sp. SALINAS62]
MIRLLAIALTVWPLSATAQQAVSQPGAELRVLDKVTGQVQDVTMQVGQAESIDQLLIQLNDCRTPVNNPSGDAFAELSVNYRNSETPVFSGWMIASAPALHALDHPRYDVWIMRCTDG